MEVAYTIGGTALHLIKYRVDDGAAIERGVPCLSDEATADTQGIIPDTTTSGVSCIGLSIDRADASTAAQVAAGAGANNDGINATFVTVCINPNAVFRAKLSGGSAEDTATTLLTAAAAVTDGLTVTGATDEATIWGLTGANAGQVRFATDAATVVVAFPFNIAAGDTFSEAILNIGAPTQTPTLTAAFTQINAAAAVAANSNYLVVEFELNDASDDGRNNSFANIVAYDHVFAGSQVA